MSFGGRVRAEAPRAALRIALGLLTLAPAALGGFQDPAAAPASVGPAPIWQMPHPSMTEEEGLPRQLVQYLNIYKNHGLNRDLHCAEMTPEQCAFEAELCRTAADRCPPREFEAYFIEGFDILVDRMPDDRLATGQGVQLARLMERRGRATEVAERCAVSAGWCAMLAGILAYEAGDWDEARRQYELTVETLVPGDACAFTDLSWILEDPGGYRGLDCDERAAANDTIWWLSDPLWSGPENHRELAHRHRIALTLLHDDLLEIHSEPGSIVDWDGHSENHHPTTLRRPWPILDRWLGAIDGPTALVSASERPRTYSFIPNRAVIEDPFHATADGWQLDPPLPFESSDHPDWDRFIELDHQAGTFRRGDRSIVVVASEMPYLEGVSQRIGTLTLSAGPGSLRTRVDTEDRDLYVLRDTVETRRWMAGVEVLAPLHRIAWRMRTSVGPPVRLPQRVTASDLVLFDAAEPDEVPRSVNDLDGVMLGRSWIDRTEPIGAFWELYGLEDEEPVTIEVGARRDRGFLDRLGLRLGIGEEDLVVGWTEGAASEDGVTPRAVALELEYLEAGEYTIEVTLTVPGQEPVVIARRVTVR